MSARWQRPDVDDLRQAVAKAVQGRPELKILASQQQVNQIEKRQNADLTKPQVNLVAGYMSNGLADSVRPRENPITASSQPLYDRVNQLAALSGLPAVPNVNRGGLPGEPAGRIRVDAFQSPSRANPGVPDRALDRPDFP